MFFFFNDTATTEIYTLSLHDALPIYWRKMAASRSSGRHTTAKTQFRKRGRCAPTRWSWTWPCPADRKSTRLNSSHANISYAVFCLKKKNHLHEHSNLQESPLIITADL